MLDECYDFTVTLKLLYSEGFVATLKSENVFLVTQVFVVSTLMYQSLYGVYCTTHGSRDLMVTLKSLSLRCYGHLKIVK